MITENYENELESKLALALALEGNNNDTLTNEQSERNISENVVGVYIFNGVKKAPENGKMNLESKSAGSGLLVTTDGWVITAYHNIKKYFEDWKKLSREVPPYQDFASWATDMTYRYAIVQGRKAFPIDPSICTVFPEFDIALIKAVTMKKPAPVEFKVLERDLVMGDEVKLFALRDQQPYTLSGKVLGTNYNITTTNPQTREPSSEIYDTFFADVKSIPGFSGGAFTTGGEFAGLCLYNHTDLEGKVIGSGGAKVKHVRSILKGMAYALGTQRSGTIEKVID